MKAILNELIDSYRADIISMTKELIAFPSVFAESENEQEPFGKPINDALLAVLGMAEKMGFATRNYEGYAGTVQWGDTGKQIGILSHIDVVPVSADWSYPPFEGTIVDGALYGRGSVDDKGPLVAALFAMKAVRDSKLPVKNHVRHIIGADEESGMRCLNYYLQHEEAPWGGFSPDAEFPVIHAEKGILRFDVKAEWEAADTPAAGIKLLAVSGGSKVNMVPAQAVATLSCAAADWQLIQGRLEKYVAQNRLELEYKDEICTITATGQNAHSSQPWQGKNAINYLLNFLGTLPLQDSGAVSFLHKIRTLFADGYRGEALGICCEDKLSGILTLSLGVLRIDDKSGSARVEIRYPIHASREVILQTLQVACLEQEVTLDVYQDKAHLYIPVKDPLVQILTGVYQEVTGRAEEPIAIGGATYCRAIENFAAYGPVFPGQVEMAHQTDEYIMVDDLILSAKIYAQALYALLNL
ncbi:MAG: dipeptidase PepV [Saccharofermentanales bacterium]|jgi:succinyl-diaminopimelate desuccinylase